MEKFRLTKKKQKQSVLKTIRLKYDTLQKIERLSIKNEISVNRVINECINFALQNLNVDD